MKVGYPNVNATHQPVLNRTPSTMPRHDVQRVGFTMTPPQSPPPPSKRDLLDAQLQRIFGGR